MRNKEKRIIIVSNAIIAILINLYQICMGTSFLEVTLNSQGMEKILTVFRIIYTGSILLNLIIAIIGWKYINKIKKNILIILNILNIILGSSGLIAVMSVLSITALVIKDEEDEPITKKKYTKYITLGLILGVIIGIVMGNTSLVEKIKPFVEGIAMGISISLTIGIIVESRKNE